MMNCDVLKIRHIVQADSHRVAAAMSQWAGKEDKKLIMSANLSDAGVGTLHVLGGQVEPASGVRVDERAVMSQCAPSFSAAPAALELSVCLQAHATAVPLGRTLVQVHCGISKTSNTVKM